MDPKYPPLKSGIFELMRDLGDGLGDPETLMLGGGNPAILEETRNFFLPILEKKYGEKGFFRKAFQSYSHPQGESGFISAIRDYFKEMTGWPVTNQHICATQGSQQGFYLLYNYLIGHFHPTAPEEPRPVLVTVKEPDYIGYFDLIPRCHFLSAAAKIDNHGDGTFSYQIDFTALENILSRDGKEYSVRALVISTPNNPSSHVLTQADANRLCALAQSYDKLLIFDHAYGFPFPNIVFEEKAVYPLTPNTLHCFSFSKIGLPGLRIGFMIGDPELIGKITVLNGIVNLAPSSFTSAFLEEALRDPGFNNYINDDLFHHYAQARKTALDFFQGELRDTPALLHRPQGGFFFWLYAPGFPLTSGELYEKIKAEKVLVVPGNYFFLDHPDETYLRISYTMEEDRVLRGLKIIADTVKKGYRKI